MVWRWLPLGLVIVVPVAAAAAVVTDDGWMIVAALAVLGILFAVPARWLPALGLLLFCTPIGYGDTQPLLYQLTPIPITFAIYFLRRWRALDIDRNLLGGAVAVLVIGLISAIEGVNLRDSMLFLGAGAVLIGGPLAVRAIPAEDHRLLVRVWAGCAIALAGFAVVEFLAAANPFDAWYSGSDYPLVQKWEGYRVLTTIGHPLLNGTFFAASFAMFCWQLVQRTAFGRSGAGRNVILIGLVASLVGVALSQSRSALVAAAVGGGVVTLISSRRLRSTSLLWTLRIVLPVALVATGSYIATGRLGGTEAEQSAQAREAVYSSFESLVDGRELFGAGPGNASTQNSNYGAFPDLPLESVVLELVVSWGYVGTAAIILLGAAYLVAVVRRGRLAALAPAAATGTAALFYNFLEGDPKVLLLTCVVLLVAATPVAPARAPARGGRRPRRVPVVAA